MSDIKGYQPSKNFVKDALVNHEEYTEIYSQSIKNTEKFWGEQAKNLRWIKKFQKIKNVSYTYPKVSIKWFEDGILNVSENCIDRHLEDKGEKVAILWESDDPSISKSITYNELHKNVCKLANVLKDNEVSKGDRVILYMPMVPEAAYAMLACEELEQYIPLFLLAFLQKLWLAE